MHCFYSNRTLTAKFKQSSITINEKKETSYVNGHTVYTLYLESSAKVSSAVSSQVVINTLGYQWDFSLDDDVLVLNRDETITITIPSGGTKSNSYTYNTQGNGNNSDYNEIVSVSSVTHSWSSNSNYKLGEKQWK